MINAECDVLCVCRHQKLLNFKEMTSTDFVVSCNFCAAPLLIQFHTSIIVFFVNIVPDTSGGVCI